MKDTELVVYREYFGRFEEVGRVAPAGGGIGFAYSESYLQSRTAQSISQALPLRSGAFPARETESFFNGILPEGSMRRSLGRAFHADIDDVGAFMARLNDESAGALVFGKGEEPLLEGRSYAPVGEEDLVRFAARPGEFAPRAASRSRLSLAGAQMKIGLFFDASSGFWFYPQGAAPSSHIVKACDGSFPDQTVNEAICMRTAAALGFDAAPCRLIPVAGQEPLLAVERFAPHRRCEDGRYRRNRPVVRRRCPVCPRRAGRADRGVPLGPARGGRGRRRGGLPAGRRSGQAD